MPNPLLNPSDALIAFARSVYLEEREGDSVLPAEPDPDRCTVEGERITLRDEDGDTLAAFEFSPKRKRSSDHEFYPIGQNTPVFIRSIRGSL